jgi:hypothetical protein
MNETLRVPHLRDVFVFVANVGYRTPTIVLYFVVLAFLFLVGLNRLCRPARDKTMPHSSRLDRDQWDRVHVSRMSLGLLNLRLLLLPGASLQPCRKLASRGFSRRPQPSDGAISRPSSLPDYFFDGIESKGQPTPKGTLPSLIGTRRIENRRSFEGHDVEPP